MTALLLLMDAQSSPFDYLQKHAQVIYPALGALVLILLVAAVLHAWRTPELAGVEKARLKGEIIRTMRKNIGWITANDVADTLELDTHTVATLMQEMDTDGLLVHGMMENLIHYRIKGT